MLIHDAHLEKILSSEEFIRQNYHLRLAILIFRTQK